ncbi:serine/threonine-protein kinase [Polyangium sorediatum]|uniref:Serine/threonine-protein kinase n=1 Tax=Polyangium sorediatum TaxID=889274 RepID=A0ABT6NL23_9BACT|nr:serine/threonine-protein kinase [Polyangium sorediatum]MDI1429015.1 serine/threonine-protein kinase [Polyangium sorediatum]
MDFVPGAMIGGKYRLERKIAEGGMGEVWIGAQVGGAQVAIKRLLPDAARDHHLVTRFRREALLLGKIESDHVSRVIEQTTDPDFGLLLVMEYVEGTSLADLLDKQGTLAVEEVLDIGEGVARAIADLHRASIVHRDVKPENVILRRLPSGERRAVLIDFGLARLLDPAEDQRGKEETLTGITRADMAVGTIPYMAPEQLLNSRDVNGTADVYALGAILYRAASGRNVFGDQDDLSYARQKLSDDAPPIALTRKDPAAERLSAIVMRAVKRRPAERYEGIEPMLKELAEARALARPQGGDVDAPTQAAPVSSLLGSAATQLPFATPAAPSPMAPPPASARFGPSAPIQRPSPALTVPMPAVSDIPDPGPPAALRRPSPAFGVPAVAPAAAPPQVIITPPAAPPPLAAMPMAAPPVAPPLGRPPVQPVAGFGEIPAAPRAAAPAVVIPADAVPRRAAFAFGLVALGVGFVLGFVAHALLAGGGSP